MIRDFFHDVRSFFLMLPAPLIDAVASHGRHWGRVSRGLTNPLRTFGACLRTRREHKRQKNLSVKRNANAAANPASSCLPFTQCLLPAPRQQAWPRGGSLPIKGILASACGEPVQATLPPTVALRAKHRQPAHAFTEPFARTGTWLRKTNGPGTSLVSQLISANGVQKRGHVQSVSRLAEQLLKVHHCHTCDGLLSISFNVEHVDC